MHFEKLLHSEIGKVFVSVILGLGLATLFKTACYGNKCYNFVGPDFNAIKNKKYKFNGKCYSYDENAVSCNKNKKQLFFT